MNIPDPAHQSDPGGDRTRRPLPWWAPWATALALAIVVIGTGSWVVATQDGPGNMDNAPAMGPAADAAEGMPPVVTGYYEDQPMEFIHTEASDADVAQMLTGMMAGSPVIHTPALGKAGADLASPVYVFTNGVQPDGPHGPFGYQPDVFGTVPGDAGYSPLRSVHLVEWADGTEPHVITNVADVIRAEQTGDVAINTPGIVVNMPVTTWPGGSR